MSVRDVDAKWEHLFPAFRTKLRAVLDTAPGGPWRIVEGYRSNERQTYLYGQGRTRPGPIVTWMRVPLSHGTGLAADVIPKAGYDAPRSVWEGLRTAYQAVGLRNGAYQRGDLGHIEWPLDDKKTRLAALQWVRAGFRDTTPQTTEIPVSIGADLIEDADAYRDPATGRIYVALRPVTDALGYAIAEVRDRQALVVDDDGEMTVPVHVVNSRGFAWSRDLSQLASVTWLPEGGLVFADR